MLNVVNMFSFLAVFLFLDWPFTIYLSLSLSNINGCQRLLREIKLSVVLPLRKEWIQIQTPQNPLNRWTPVIFGTFYFLYLWLRRGRNNLSFELRANTTWIKIYYSITSHSHSYKHLYELFCIFWFLYILAFYLFSVIGSLRFCPCVDTTSKSLFL